MTAYATTYAPRHPSLHLLSDTDVNQLSVGKPGTQDIPPPELFAGGKPRSVLYAAQLIQPLRIQQIQRAELQVNGSANAIVNGQVEVPAGGRIKVPTPCSDS